jgi:hypothetical protein
MEYVTFDAVLSDVFIKNSHEFETTTKTLAAQFKKMATNFNVTRPRLGESCNYYSTTLHHLEKTSHSFYF